MRTLIITADDFGLAPAVNDAVERAHRHGILSTTSLLIGGVAAGDAVVCAQRNPGLRVGLHVALCEGRPLCARHEIPDLVGKNGEFYGPIGTALRLFKPRIALQIEREVRAQFAAFAATGLALDHVNAHNNLQLHPVVLPILLRIAREYGAPAIRLPYEPLAPALKAVPRGVVRKIAIWSVLRPWSAYVKRRIQAAGFAVNDFLFGMYDCGALEPALFKRLVEHLPPGVSEIHCHPASRRCPEIDLTMPGYQHEAELAALLDPALREAVTHGLVQQIAGFSALRANSAPQELRTP